MDRQRELLFHDGTNTFCQYHRKTQEYTFVLRTAGGISEVLCYINGKEYEMFSEDRGDIQYYRTTFQPMDSFLKYYFKILENSGRTLYYDALGVAEYLTGRWEFCLTPGFFTPEWAKGAVMYQIMVDRFCNGDRANDVQTNEYTYIGKGVEKVYDWYETPSSEGMRQFYGGDLQGVINKLDYLEQLGIEVIYLNPIFVSPSNHKYDTQDYEYIDPHFGKIVVDTEISPQGGTTGNVSARCYKVRTTSKQNLIASNELFISLVEQAHQRGIKVILDGVFNHCGSFHPWLDREKLYRDHKDYGKGAYGWKDSPFHNFFRFFGGDWPDNGNYEGWWNFDTLPKLNYENSEELCEYMIEIGKKWVSAPYYADGWRLDVAADLGNSVQFNHRFWKRFRNAVKEANPQAIILAEHYGDANAWLLGDEWDTIMNYDGFMDPVSWFLTGIDKHSEYAKPELRGNAEVFVETLRYHMAKIQSQSLLTAMNELSNHDHSRFLTRTNQRVGRLADLGPQAAAENIDEAIFKQGVVMQMTLPGAPTIYYGDEAGLCGWTDPDNRRTYPWGEENLEIMEFYREAINIHKQNPVLQTGSYIPLLFEKNLLCYARFGGTHSIIVALNTADIEKVLCIPVWKTGSTDGTEYERLLETYREFYNCGRVRFAQKGDELTVVLAPQASAIYKRV